MFGKILIAFSALLAIANASVLVGHGADAATVSLKQGTLGFGYKVDEVNTRAVVAPAVVKTVAHAHAPAPLAYAAAPLAYAAPLTYDAAPAPLAYSAPALVRYVAAAAPAPVVSSPYVAAPAAYGYEYAARPYAFGYSYGAASPALAYAAPAPAHPAW